MKLEHDYDNGDGPEEEFVQSVVTLLNRVMDNGLSTAVFALGDCQTRLLDMRVERFKALVKAREQYRLPNYKDKDGPKLTDLDRRTMMAAHTADVEADYELVAGLEKLVAERVDLIKVLLRTK